MSKLLSSVMILRDIDLPSGIEADLLKTFYNNDVLTFTNVTFVNCRFNFAPPPYYVFVCCHFDGCDMSTLRKDRLVSCDVEPNCVGFRGFNCPPTGAFEAWKICADVWTNEAVLAKLLVPEEAHRVTVPFDRKCRVSSARVKGLYFADGTESKKAFSLYDPAFSYEPNVILLPEGEWKQNTECCGAGIHVFTDPYDAIDYGLFAFRNGYRRETMVRRNHKTGTLEIVYREDGSCPYPLRMAPGFPNGNWEWVDKLLYS